MPVLNHIHSYIKFSASQMQCSDPYCSHLQTKDRLVGKVSRCPICKITDFILTRADLKLAKPRCVNCSQTKAAKKFKENRDQVKAQLEAILGPDAEKKIFDAYDEANVGLHPSQKAVNPIVDLHKVKNVLQDFLNPSEEAMDPIIDLHEEDM